VTGYWPWPGDTPLDRARRIALSFRNALYEISPDAAMAIDDQVTGWGELWVVPAIETVDLDDWVTVDVAASHVGLTAKAVYNWVYTRDLESKTGNDKRLRVKLRDVLEMNRDLRERRIARQARRPDRHSGAA
jgi:hypothetical protein